MTTDPIEPWQSSSTSPSRSSVTVEPWVGLGHSSKSIQGVREPERCPLERVLPDWSIPPVDVHVVFPSGKLPSRLRTFIDFAVEELPRGIQRLSALGRAGR